MRPIHRLAFRVRDYETDPHGRLRAAVLCRLLQEAATEHAARLGVAVEALIGSGVAWVLSRLSLRVERWPGVDDEIVVSTWPEAANRLVTERCFEIAGADGSVVATASTLWLILDLERRRPVRMPAGVLEALARHDIGDQPARPDELGVPDPADLEVVFSVRRSDLDRAGHVNNTSYVEWAMEAVPDEVWAGSDLVRFEVAYLAECHRGQTVVSRSQRFELAAGAELRHQIVRREDGHEVARAWSSWRPRG
jgi:medium-chain acyl-[acyl-carrier-protein] hydrolase